VGCGLAGKPLLALLNAFVASSSVKPYRLSFPKCRRFLHCVEFELSTYIPSTVRVPTSNMLYGWPLVLYTRSDLLNMFTFVGIGIRSSCLMFLPVASFGKDYFTQGRL